MKITIETVSNGFIIECPSDQTDGEIKKIVVEAKDSEAKAAAALIREIMSIIGPMDNKYSEERVYVRVAPGMDSQNFKGLDWDYKDNVKEYVD